MSEYKINIEPYERSVFIVKNGETVEQSQIVEPVELLEATLLNPQLELSGLDMYRRGKTLDKIKATREGNTITVSDSDYETIKNCLDKIKGFTQAHMEYITRIMEAQKID